MNFKAKVESLFKDFSKIKMLIYSTFLKYLNNLEMYNKTIFDIKVKMLSVLKTHF